MKKQIINYSFDASEKKITFSDYTSIRQESILLITNVTDGIVIYNFADSALGGTVATNVLTLDYNTTTMSDTDKLQIFYEENADKLEGGGKISVGLTAVEMTFTKRTKSIILTADASNTGTIYVGGSTVASDGSNAIIPLAAGDSVTIDFDDNEYAIYAVASVASQYVWKGAIV